MNVLTINATQQNGIISVSGTTDAEMYAVAISIYDESGTNLITVETAAANDGVFSHSIAIAEGNYQICVADYSGGECMTTTVLVTSEDTDSTTSSDATVSSPETGYQTVSSNNEQVTPDANAANNPMLAICLASAVILAVTASMIIIKRRLAHRKIK